MSRSDFDRLFDQLETLSVGFGPFFRDSQVSTSAAHYPPHNIVRNTDNVLILELAVAGFKKHQITASIKEGILTIKGDKTTGTEDPVDTYQYRGIANRSFSKSFRVAEFYDIIDAGLEDGILSITFMKNIPDEALPKVIVIR